MRSAVRAVKFWQTSYGRCGAITGSFVAWLELHGHDLSRNLPSGLLRMTAATTPAKPENARDPHPPNLLRNLEGT